MVLGDELAVEDVADAAFQRPGGFAAGLALGSFAVVVAAAGGANGGFGISGLSDLRFQDGEIAHRVAAVLAFLFHHDAQAPPDRAGLIGIARRG